LVYSSFNLFEQQLSEKLGAKIDIATPKAINKYIKNDVLKSIQVIYGK